MFSIYKIECGGECYIGHTSNYTKRVYDHQARMKVDKYKNYNLYKKMNENPFNFELLENIECDKKDIFKHEQKYIDKYKSTLNMRRATYSIEIARETNKLRMREAQKHYSEEKKKHIKEIQHKWYEKNRDEFKKKALEYYNKHKVKLVEKQNVKIRCELCNCEFIKRCLIQHQKSKKHLKNEKNNI